MENGGKDWSDWRQMLLTDYRMSVDSSLVGVDVCRYEVECD